MHSAAHALTFVPVVLLLPLLFSGVKCAPKSLNVANCIWLRGVEERLPLPHLLLSWCYLLWDVLGAFQQHVEIFQLSHFRYYRREYKDCNSS